MLLIVSVVYDLAFASVEIFVHKGYGKTDMCRRYIVVVQSARLDLYCGGVFLRSEATDTKVVQNGIKNIVVEKVSQVDTRVCRQTVSHYRRRDIGKGKVRKQLPYRRIEKAVSHIGFEAHCNQSSLVVYGGRVGQSAVCSVQREHPFGARQGFQNAFGFFAEVIFGIVRSIHCFQIEFLGKGGPTLVNPHIARRLAGNKIAKPRMAELMHYDRLRIVGKRCCERMSQTYIVHMLHASLCGGAVSHPIERKRPEASFHVCKCRIEHLEVAIHLRTVRSKVIHL